MSASRFCCFLLVPLLLPSLGRAQIRDNETSRTILAVQCAVSSGFSVEDFEEYSRKLAKTIGKLDSAQQTRVFGFLPNPGGGGGESAGDAPLASVAAGVSTESAEWIKQSQTSAPAIAGASEEDWLAASAAAGGNGGDSKAPGRGSRWGEIVSWFKRADEAYRNGSLSDFLKEM